jgi:uncharacterized protein
MEAEDEGGVARVRRRSLLVPASGSMMSALAICLLLKWGWGCISAPDVQQLAMAAKLSGLEDVEVEDLASIGAFGANADSCHRDLMNKFCKHLLQSKIMSSPLSVRTLVLYLYRLFTSLYRY